MHPSHVYPLILRCPVAHPYLPSFPTRRSSDLFLDVPMAVPLAVFIFLFSFIPLVGAVASGERDEGEQEDEEDRKSTRLNSSHRTTSYAVFCLKKKDVQACAAAMV